MAEKKKSAVKVRVPRDARLARFIMGPFGKVALVSLVLIVSAGIISFVYFYVKYSRLIDQKLNAGPFGNTSKIFAAPKVVGVGDPISASDLALELRLSG